MRDLDSDWKSVSRKAAKTRRRRGRALQRFRRFSGLVFLGTWIPRALPVGCYGVGLWPVEEYILIAKNYCGNGIVGVWNTCRYAGIKKSDSGAETPVPALLFGRGCLSTPSSRLGPDASALGLSAIFFGNQYNPVTLGDSGRIFSKSPSGKQRN